MTPNQTLQKLVHDKIERQVLLRGISREMAELDTELSGSKFSRFFGTSYWFIKRWLTLLVGLALLLLGIFYMVAPDAIYDADPEMFSSSREVYEEMHKEQIAKGLDLLQEAVVKAEDLTLESISESMSRTYDDYIVQEIQEDIRDLGALFFFLALVLLYISRQARVVRERNSAISERESLVQDMSRKFQEVIEGEEEELQKLKSLLNKLG